MNLSAIENKLLEKETAIFKKEIDKASDIIISAFAKYYDYSEATHSKGRQDGFKNESHKELNEYLSSVVGARSQYFGGNYTNIQKNTIAKLPESLKEMMVKRAVIDFFESIEQIKEISDNLEG